MKPQTLLLLRDTEESEINRIINIDLLATASVDPENPERTIAGCGVFEVKMNMPFSRFLEQVQNLIAENYRIGHETEIKWHKKRVADQEAMMKEVMFNALNN